MDRWLNIGVLGGACWPKKEQKIDFHGHDLILGEKRGTATIYELRE